MDAAAPTPVTFTDEQNQALTVLQRNTTYLWKSFVTLPAEQNGFTCPIRQATFQKIRHALEQLSAAGLFEFSLLHTSSSNPQSSHQLEIANIADAFKASVRERHEMTDGPLPSSASRNQAARTPIPSCTQPLTLQNAPLLHTLPSLKLDGLLQSWRQRGGHIWRAQPGGHIWRAASLLTLGMAVLATLTAEQTNTPTIPLPAPDNKRTDTKTILPSPAASTATATATPQPTPQPVRLHTPVVFAKHPIQFPSDADPIMQTEPAQSPRIVVVDIPTLHLYSLPSYQGTPLKELKLGVDLLVHWRENGWLQVTDRSNTTGWVMAFATRDATTRQRLTVHETFGPALPPGNPTP